MHTEQGQARTGAVAKSVLQSTRHSLLCFYRTEPQLSPTLYFPSQRKVNEHHKQGNTPNTACNTPWILHRYLSLFLPFLGASHCLSHLILHWRKGSSPPLLFVLLLLMFTFVNFKKPLLSVTELWQEIGFRLSVHLNQRGELVPFGDLLDYRVVFIRNGAQPQRSLFFPWLLRKDNLSFTHRQVCWKSQRGNKGICASLDWNAV